MAKAIAPLNWNTDKIWFGLRRIDRTASKQSSFTHKKRSNPPTEQERFLPTAKSLNYISAIGALQQAKVTN
jgi:hypothetical protein